MAMTITKTVELITRYAMAAGLAPHTMLVGPQRRRAYRGVVELFVNGPGQESPFGTVRIGARSGKVLGGCIRFGNHGRVEHYAGARAVLAALRTLAKEAS